ncbi:MAG: RimK/LysX family protein [Bacteroidota bacterium]
MQPKKYKVKIIGRREYIHFPLLDIEQVEAKIDTGAYTCAIDCNHIELITRDDKSILSFRLFNNTTYTVEEFTQKKIKNSFGEMEERYIIKTLITIGRKKINTTISLSDRGNMRYPVLIGRRLLKGKFIIDVNLIYTNGLNLKTLLI